MQNDKPGGLNKRDIIRLILAIALCATAVLVYYARENPRPTTPKNTYATVLYTPIASSLTPSATGSVSVPASNGGFKASLTYEPIKAEQTEAKPSVSPSPSISTTPKSNDDVPNRLDLLPEDVPKQVVIDLSQPLADVAATEPPADNAQSVMPNDSPEKNEQTPESEVRLDAVDRKRDGALRVLIYHTHTEEAYEQTAAYTYVPHGKWHTQNNNCNVVAVGEELARLLEEKYNMVVTHDTTNHEMPNFDTAYTRSLETIAAYSDKGETFDLYLDLHRDSYAKKHAENTVTIDGVNAARLMFLIGKGQNFAQKPDWEKNLALANEMTEKLNGIRETFADKVTIYNGNRYNQHVSPNALLVEVGNNKNTLEEALAAMPYLAEVIDIVMGG